MKQEHLGHSEHLEPIEYRELSDEELLKDIRLMPELAWIEDMVIESMVLTHGENYINDAHRPKIEQGIAFSAREILKRFKLDPLTGLLNKEGLKMETEKQMRMAISANSSAIFVALDLDGFKGVNDNHGHDEGDNVLRRFARLLARVTRSSDPKARESGDEFSLFAVAPEDFAFFLATRISDGAPKTSPHSPVSTSMGISVLRPGDTYHNLKKRAELGLQWSKFEGKNKATVIYEVDQQPKVFQFTNRDQIRHDSAFSVYSTAIGKPPDRHDRIS